MKTCHHSGLNFKVGEDMKRFFYILVLALVLLVVMVSGCTSDQWASNKTYSGNGVTFQYPGAWTDEDPSSLSSFTSGVNVVTGVGNTDYTFVLGSIPTNVSTDQIQQYLQQVKTNWKAIPGATVLSEKELTVDGASAIEVNWKLNNESSSDVYVSAVSWVKNAKAYVVIYGSRNNDTQTLDRILSTMKST